MMSCLQCLSQLTELLTTDRTYSRIWGGRKRRGRPVGLMSDDIDDLEFHVACDGAHARNGERKDD